MGRVFWTLVAGMLLQTVGARSALASCGDWLEHSASPWRALTAELPGKAVLASSEPRLPVFPPCDGPGCQRAPQHSIPPVSPRLSLAVKDAYCSPAAGSWMPPGDARSEVLVSVEHPQRGYPRRVERPPRLPRSR